ncbi:hypothetical protein AB0B50_22490 [Streptomyces sp. NPDC041068]|uniref:hypothetical protein n=1 Tax=Streptomyces sp. NPDC041068 TaxID=3155130 RepID=UPI0034049F3F
MITRLVKYALTYPLWFYAVLGLGWSYGLTFVYQAVHRTEGIASAPGLAVTAVTIAVNLLLFRAVDDVRDLDYDRVQNPGRALVTGAVRVGDLMTLFFAGMAVLVLVNVPRGLPAAAYGAVCAYVCVVLFIEWRWEWPRPERLLAGLLVNIPHQLLMCGYVYLGTAHGRDNAPGPLDLVVALGFVLLLAHLEFARRLVRDPAPHMRTYVHTLGVRATRWTALGCAFAAAALQVAALRPWSPGQAAGWLVLVPLPVPVLAAVRFHRGAPRWPLGLAVLFLLLSFSSFAAIGLVNAL